MVRSHTSCPHCSPKDGFCAVVRRGSVWVSRAGGGGAAFSLSCTGEAPGNKVNSSCVSSWLWGGGGWGVHTQITMLTAGKSKGTAPKRQKPCEKELGSEGDKGESSTC